MHLNAFLKMVSFFHNYDHVNYAKWGAVYLAEITNLLAVVVEDFRRGNFNFW